MSEENWAKDTADGILIGYEHIPAPIKEHMLRTFENRINIKNVYHITEILYCLRKAYLARMHPNDIKMHPSSIWHIYRGSTFDAAWSPLFEINQRTYQVEREGKTVTGKLDFVWFDEEKFEKVLYDLKMPKHVYYRKKEGAGKFYTEQVQTYLAMAHENGELTDVHRCRVMFLADDLVIAEVPMNDKILDYVFDRVFKLSDALETKDSSKLEGPAEPWECKVPYCMAPAWYREECAKCPKYPL